MSDAKAQLFFFQSVAMFCKLWWRVADAGLDQTGAADGRTK